jgi:hypothetical protein
MGNFHYITTNDKNGKRISEQTEKGKQKFLYVPVGVR